MDPDLIDANLVFAKTPAGEEAMLQRTRVVQRNVRMVLILVDGNATVAELCDKTGNAPITQNALLELEHDGFIERRIEKNSVWRHAKDSPTGIVATAIRAVSEFSTFGDNAAAPVEEPVSDDQKGRSIPLPDSESRGSHPSRAPLSLTPQPSLSGGPLSGAALQPQQETTVARPAATAEAEPAKPSLVDRLKAIARPATENDEPALKPIRRGRRRWSLTWSLGLLLGGLSLCAVLFLLALFFPYANYLPEVEAGLAQSIGQPARIDRMRVSVYPRPGLLLVNVRLGEGSEGLEIAEVRLQPELQTLRADKILFREAELSDVRLSVATISNLSRMLASVASPSARVGVQQLTISNAAFSFSELAIDEMDGHCELSTDHHLESISLRSRDRALLLKLNPSERGLTVQIDAIAWRVAQGSPFLFDSLNVKGVIEGSDWVIDSFESRIFDGVVRAAMILRDGQQAAIAGELSFERINARKLGEALGIGSQFQGEAHGKLKFSANSASWPGLPAALQASGNFTMRRGRLGGIDLPEAVRRSLSTPATLGGWTRFEELSGAITVTPDAFLFSRLALNAGLMQSSGQIELTRKLQLRGRMDVQMRGQADHSSRSILISGPLKSPLTQTANH
ncbi:MULTISPECIES: AsmA-like C-terminal region-containing protein [Candidatus Accumulibacter]|uniref:Uncharacterized protein n=2 Tax=Candidatus Accumulibacter TaxID=327159 RepID=A0A080M3Y1_9PROT|nr:MULTISPECIES: AsmA-like C-terminal region-containing protein [Candidatus Accumulibacter]KFB76017.1 MAG: putative protein involved in outer membrane biogenesis [Candidatus Accumulibacter cognatus]MCC2869121.1 AsmA-like C-terminal region-containing protein [Candidatus Accumulibacter phosphatis]TMQ76572.1 hypothetical protein ACCUM_4138 [Candidatus Accumulibacter phosphatis]